jgi:tRNA G18 (ribose-2'-O)-methylase SpoU
MLRFPLEPVGTPAIGVQQSPFNVNDSPSMRKLAWDEIDRPNPEELADLPRHPVSVVAHNIRSIYNVGALFRTGDAARIEHLYVTGYTGTPDHKDLHKTALGAQDLVPWSTEDDVFELLEDLRSQGYTIAALELTDASQPPAALAADAFPLALVLGNEVHGIDREVLAACDVALEIPQYGAKQSLNVSVAFGIAVYDLVRRYRSLSSAPT